MHQALYRKDRKKKKDPYIIINTAPADAPCEMPSTYGSANVFFVKACIIIPQSVSPAPTKNATNTLGNLISHMMDSILLSHVTSTTLLPLNLLDKNPAMSFSSMSTLPKMIEITIETQSIRIIIKINPKYVLFDSRGKKCFLNFDILISIPRSSRGTNSNESILHLNSVI